MSYLTGKCQICNGTARIHKNGDTECQQNAGCPGCVRCRDCIDGKVVNLPGLGGTHTRGPSTISIRASTTSQSSKKPSAQESGDGAFTVAAKEASISGFDLPPAPTLPPPKSRPASAEVRPESQPELPVEEAPVAYGQRFHDDGGQAADELNEGKSTVASVATATIAGMGSKIASLVKSISSGSVSESRRVVPAPLIINQDTLKLGEEHEEDDTIDEMELPEGAISRRATGHTRRLSQSLVSIVKELHSAPSSPTKPSHHQSLELLTEKAVTTTNKVTFEEREEELTPLVKQTSITRSAEELSRKTTVKLPPQGPTTPPQVRQKSDVFAYSRPKRTTATSDADVSPKTSAVESPTRSRTPSANQSVNLSGGVGARKAKKAVSTLPARPSSADSVSEKSTPATPSSSSSASPTKKSNRSFREWYTNFASDSAQLNLQSTLEENEFPDAITLELLFGYKGEETRGNDAADAMINAYRCYEAASSDPLWDKPTDKEVSGESNVDPELAEDVACMYRPLNIFVDEKLEGLRYSNDTNEAGVEIVTAGKPEHLMDALIFPLNQDMTFAKVFLASYRFFMPAVVVLNTLIEWYNVDLDVEAFSPPGTLTGGDESQDAETPSGSSECAKQDQFFKKHHRQIQSRAIGVLILWVKNHWNDFQCDRKMFGLLMAFMEHVSQISFGDGQKLTQAVREQRLLWFTTRYIPAFTTKRSAMYDMAKPWALAWTPEEFAREITLVDHFLFRHIRPDSYLQVLSHPVPKEGAGRNVALRELLEYVVWFRLVGAYFATIILREDSSKRKAKVIKRAIKIAKAGVSACRGIRNFNTMFAIIWALRRPAVVKATHAWEALSSKSISALKKLTLLMDPTDGYANYWAEFKDAQPPAIPFLATYMHDILEIHREAPTYMGETAGDNGNVAAAPKTRRKGRGRGTGGEKENFNTSEIDEQPFDSSRADRSTLTRTIYFQKFYDLYSIIAELEVFRTGQADGNTMAVMYEQTGDTDNGAIVFTHMRDFAVDKVSGRWMDDVLSGPDFTSNASPPTAADTLERAKSGSSMKSNSSQIGSGVSLPV
ncbi:ras guanine nucleotide exchange factor domain-containing protein [Gaertneriomyces semiglobifer]|nr:ras guanine nucleotide exchange factor domain-containing protein [Gaertneriomyces semiglobifer]